MSRFFLLAGLALFAGHAAAEVKVDVSLVAPDALQVNYTLPAECSKLSFLKGGPWAGRIRARWQAQGDCGAATGDNLTRGAASCKVVSFRVPATSNKVAGYPGSFPTGAAIYAHMSNYAVGGECGAVEYSYSGPGSIATKLARHQGSAMVDADAPALLFSARLPDGAKDLDYFDPVLKADTVAQIRDRAKRTEAALLKAMPNTPYQRPIIASTLASEPGGPNIGGSAGDVLHLALFNWPSEASPETERMLTVLVAHEMSHRFQMRDAVDDYPDARLIHEGGGEFLRWMVSLQEGWLTPQQAGVELDDALAKCMIIVGDRRWRDVPAREIGANQLEYNCGLPAYVYAMAARQGKGSTFGRIEAFYQQLRAGGKPDFAQSMECGSKPCKPTVLPAVLAQPAPMREQWAALFRSTGLAQAGTPSQAHLDSMMLQALAKMMQADCDGKSSMTPAFSQARLLVDSLPGCQTVRADVEVLRVEGKPVFGSMEALPALLQACGSRQSIELGLKDGKSLALPCRAPYQPTQVYAADMGKIMRALKAR